MEQLFNGTVVTVDDFKVQRGEAGATTDWGKLREAFRSRVRAVMLEPYNADSPAATYLAESKPYQLSVAASCGFQVPVTLATNDASSIRETFPGSLVIKSLDTVLLRDGDDCLDAKHISEGPVWQGILPYPLPLGLHGTFAKS